MNSERKKWIRKHYPPKFNRMNTFLILESLIFGLIIIYFSLALKFKENYMMWIISFIGVLYLFFSATLVRYILKNRHRKR